MNEKTTLQHWNNEWTRAPRLRLPSALNVTTRNLQRLLRKHVKPGMRFLELGCAPGKILVWVAKVLKAEVTGLDYSEVGIEHARRLFQALHVQGALLCEDLFNNSLQPATFDIVYSAGLIEHFDDPLDAVRVHLQLLTPGGTAIIAVPNYSGFYGRILGRLNPVNLALHNLSIINLPALRQLGQDAGASDVQAYHFGRFDPWILSFPPGWSKSLRLWIQYTFNGFGVLQPFDLGPLCPLLVMKITAPSS